MRSWVVDLLLSAITLSWGCARVQVRPTGPRGIPLVRVALVKGAEKVYLSSNGTHKIVVGRKHSASEGRVTWLVSLREGKLRVQAGDRKLVKDPALPIIFVPEKEGTAAVNGRPYRGQVRVEAGPGSGLTVINVIGLEDYLKGVLPCELGPVRQSTFEAAKAQAVAARTYALKHIKGSWGKGYDLECSQADQVYRGFGAESELANRAIEETFGLVATHRGEVIEAKYSSTCGGRTANVEDCWGGEAEPYLRSIYDGPHSSLRKGKPFCSESPRFKWTVKWKWRDFFRQVKKNLAPLVGRPESEIGEVLSLKIANRDRSERVKTIEVKTTREVHRVTGLSIRKLLQTSRGWLGSRAFHLQLRGDWVVAEGRGYGHGVGMCQWGAMGMAKRGYSFTQILKHYYQGIEIRKIY